MMSRECPASVRTSTSPIAFFLLLKNFVIDLVGLHACNCVSVVVSGLTQTRAGWVMQIILAAAESCILSIKSRMKRVKVLITKKQKA